MRRVPCEVQFPDRSAGERRGCGTVAYRKRCGRGAAPPRWAILRPLTVRRAYRRYEQQRALRAIREPITSRIFGSILHCDGGARDLWNHLMAQRAPETWWEIDWLYKGIETPR